MILQHLEAFGLTFSTLMLVSVMLSTQQSKLYLVGLTGFTTAVLFTTVVAWFCILDPAHMPPQILRMSQTAAWWGLPFPAGVAAYHNYQLAGSEQRTAIRRRFIAVLVIVIVITVGLELLG